MKVLFDTKKLKEDFTVGTIAKKCNLSKKSIYKWGDVHNLRVSTIVKLEINLNVDMADYLIYNDTDGTFGGRLKILRHLSGCDTQMLTSELDFSGTRVNLLENNKVRPTGRELDTIANFFAIDKKYLIEGGFLRDYL